jgi:group I intron endonuclease
MSQDFSKGKIYKITNDYNDDVYVGSTCNTLVKRFIQHKSSSKNMDKQNTPLYKLFIEIGFERFRIQLICNYACEDKYQLRQKEGEFIRQIGTLNKIIEGRTKKEWLEDNKHKLKEQSTLYRAENKERIKQYREENQEKTKEYNKTYRKEHFEENKEKENERKRNDYHNRKDEIRIRMTCECGIDVCKRDLPKHLKTQKHFKLIEQKSN